MAESPNRFPRPAWADPILGALVLLVLLGIQLQLAGRRSLPAPERITPQLRQYEWRLLEAEAKGSAALREETQQLRRERLAPFDALALSAWLRLRGASSEAQLLLEAIPAGSGAAQHRTWAETLQAPPPGLRAKLGHSLVGRWLDLPRDTPSARETLAASVRREAGGLQAGLGLCFLAGLGFMAWLALSKRQTQEPGALEVPGTQLLKVFLVWFLLLLGSGSLVSLLLSVLPFLRPLALPLAYLLHAGAALAGLVLISGETPRAFLQRLALRPSWRVLPWCLGFGAATLLSLFLAGLLIAPWWPFRELPQQSLLELLATAQGLDLAAFFITAALLAPLFEETLFRGVLLPWLRAKWIPRLGVRWSSVLALTVSALCFGLSHLEPAGLPTLTVLGFCLGWARLRSGSLWVPILLHGAWNAGLLVMNRGYLLP